MITVKWYWVDGSVDEFTVESMKHAEEMRDNLYKNSDIVSVDINNTDMTTYKIGTIDKDDAKWFENANKGFKVTGKTLEEIYEDGSTTYVVFTGTWTRYEMCRDCGDHYIIARYSRYDRIEKGTFEVTKDVDDR